MQAECGKLEKHCPMDDRHTPSDTSAGAPAAEESTSASFAVGDWQVELQNFSALWEAPAVAAVNALYELLEAEEKSESAFTVRLAADEEVRALNRQFRDKDKPTNVLSFPCDEEKYLGDIILAEGVLQAEAAEKGVAVEHHMMHLVVHGVLHLLGYDHETEAEAEEMEDMERQVLKMLGLADPYA